MNIYYAALLTLSLGVSAQADISDSGNLTLGAQAVIQGTATVQGNAFSVGGSTLVVNGGNVGIGTASPGAPLDVEKNFSGDGKIGKFFNTTSIANTFVSIGQGGASRSGTLWYHDTNNDGTQWFGIGNDGDNIANGTGLLVRKGGSVGIGTASPGGILEIDPINTNLVINDKGSATQISGVLLQNNGTSKWQHYDDKNDSDKWKLDNVSGSRLNTLTATSAGSVGISTVTPTDTLSVAGSVNITSGLKYNTATGTNGPLTSGQTMCGGTWNNGIYVGGAACNVLGALVSSFTHVTAGTALQQKFIVCFATVTLTPSANHDLFVEIEGGVSVNAANASVNWSFFIDGAYYGSMTNVLGAGSCGGNHGGYPMTCATRYQIPAGKVSNASHNFCWTIADGGGNTVAFPVSYSGLGPLEMRFGVYEAYP